jgi:hypothetical protein
MRYSTSSRVAITYQTHEPAHAIEVAGRHGLRVLSPQKAQRELPDFVLPELVKPD